MLNEKIIDMHVHSTHSDGELTVEEILNYAKTKNVGTLSITDHDSLNANYQTFSSDINYINGIEFSSNIYINNKRVKIHLLGYNMDLNNSKLLKFVDLYKEKRLFMHQKSIEILKELYLGISDEIIESLYKEEYCWFDRFIIKKLTENNVSEVVIRDVQNYFKLNRFSYTDSSVEYEMEFKDVLEIIRVSDGISILAHPFSYNLDKNEILLLINKLINHGIKGVEVYQSDCSFEDSFFLKKICESKMLLQSVGSDFHKFNSSDNREIGTGIENNLCYSDCTLVQKIRRKI